MKIQSDKPAYIIKSITSQFEELVYDVGKRTSLSLVMLLLGKEAQNVSACINLCGQGATAQVFGIIYGSGDTQKTLHTLQHHESPDTTSDLLVKSVVTDHAVVSYDGAIKVDKDAQKTDAYQRNENLLISDTAKAYSKPSLEILANDVRCTHGATVGTVSEEQMWYLQSRGISTEKARRLIIEGFLESVIGKIGDTNVQKQIRRKLWQTI